MEAWDSSRINEKKEVLAYELTSLVHGENEAKKAQEDYAKFLNISTNPSPTQIPTNP